MPYAPSDTGLAAFNALSAAEAEAGLLSCCASPRFASEMAAGRPYRDRSQVEATAAAVIGGLPWPDVLSALRAHPRIGERPDGAGRESAWSRGEQSGVEAAGRDVRDRLADGNLAYEERFGHIYLVCAAGLGAEELLGRLLARLDNDETGERAVVRDELAKIARLRLAKLVEGSG